MRQFYEKNKKPFYLCLGYTVLCFGFMLTHYAPNIDEETWLLNENDTILWLLQNRYTVYLYNLLFTEHGRFIPFFASMTGILFWSLSGFLFACVFFDFEKKDRLWLRTLLLCYYSSIPFCVGEAFSFSMLIVPESIGLVLTALAFLMTVRLQGISSGAGSAFGNAKSKNIRNIACILFLLTVALGTYQALIGVYVTAVAGWCLCRFLEEKPFKSGFIRGVLFSAASIGLYYVINLIIAAIFGTAGYLSNNYVQWTNGESPLYNLSIALANVGRVSFAIPYQGVSVYGGETLRIVTILFVLLGIFLFFREKGIMRKLGVLFFTLGLVTAPFSLYIALGTYKTQGRMMIALSLSGMIELLLIFNYITKEFWEKLAGILVIGILLANASNMNRIYYYNYLVYRQDSEIAHEIIYDLKKSGCDYRNKAVVFIGKAQRDDIGISSSATLGASFFEWDGGNIKRMIDFIKLEGCVLGMPAEEQIEEGLLLKDSMAPWPLEGSIVETSDCIVIYLSEPDDKWYQTNLMR